MTWVLNTFILLPNVAEQSKWDMSNVTKIAKSVSRAFLTSPTVWLALGFDGGPDTSRCHTSLWSSTRTPFPSTKTIPLSDAVFKNFDARVWHSILFVQ